MCGQLKCWWTSLTYHDGINAHITTTSSSSSSSSFPATRCKVNAGIMKFVTWFLEKTSELQSLCPTSGKERIRCYTFVNMFQSTCLFSWGWAWNALNQRLGSMCFIEIAQGRERARRAGKISLRSCLCHLPWGHYEFSERPLSLPGKYGTAKRGEQGKDQLGHQFDIPTYQSDWIRWQ